MQLIDKEKVLKELLESDSHHVSNSRESVLLDRNRYIVRSQPTVEAYTKDEVFALILDIRNQIVDRAWNIDMYDDDLDFECCYLSDVDNVIQKKINMLGDK